MGAACSKDPVVQSDHLPTKLVTGEESASLLRGTTGQVLTIVADPTSPTGFFVGYASGSVSYYRSPQDAHPTTTWSAHTPRAVTQLSLGGQGGEDGGCGVLLASASRDATIKLWRAPLVSSPSVSVDPAPLGVLKGHELTVASLDVSPGGTRVASGGRDCSVKVWDAVACKEIHACHVPQNVVTCMQWGVGGGGEGATIIQGGEDLRVRLWDVRAQGQLKCASTLEGFTYFPLHLHAHPDGIHLATSSKGFNGQGCEVRVWDLRKAGEGGGGGGGGGEGGGVGGRSGALLHTFKGHHQDATACLFSGEDGSLLLSASKDSTVRAWEWKTGEEGGGGKSAVPPKVLSKPGANFTTLAVTQDGNTALAGYQDGVAMFKL